MAGISKITREQKKDLAKILITKERLSQKEAAAKVGTTEATVSRWAKEGNWDKLKTSILVTKEEQLARMYIQLELLNDSIEGREEGERFASSKEADTLIKLTTAIRNMESKETSLADTISVSVKLLNWLRKFDLEKAQELSDTFDGYIRTLLK
ncbi:MAG: DDE transposase family protein [Bacteroidales bacterium]